MEEIRHNPSKRQLMRQLTSETLPRHRNRSWHKKALLKVILHAWHNHCIMAHQDEGKRERILRRRRIERETQKQMERERTISLILRVTFENWKAFLTMQKRNKELRRLRDAQELENQEKQKSMAESTERLSSRIPSSIACKTALQVQWKAPTVTQRLLQRPNTERNMRLSRPLSVRRANTSLGLQRTRKSRHSMSPDNGSRKHLAQSPIARDQAKSADGSPSRPQLVATDSSLQMMAASPSGLGVSGMAEGRESLQNMIIDEERSISAKENGARSLRLVVSDMHSPRGSPVKPFRPTSAPVRRMERTSPVVSGRRVTSKSSLGTFRSHEVLKELRAPESTIAGQFRKGASRGGFRNTPKVVTAIYKSGPVPGTPLRPPLNNSHSLQPGKQTTSSKVDALVKTYLANHYYGGTASLPTFKAGPSKRSLRKKSNQRLQEGPSNQDAGQLPLYSAALQEAQLIPTSSIKELQKRNITQKKKMEMLSHIMSGNLKVYKSMHST